MESTPKATYEVIRKGVEAAKGGMVSHSVKDLLVAFEYLEGKAAGNKSQPKKIES